MRADAMRLRPDRRALRHNASWPTVWAHANPLVSDGGGVFRSDISTGPDGSQIVFDDPSGTPIELFQPAGNPQAR